MSNENNITIIIIIQLFTAVLLGGTVFLNFLNINRSKKTVGVKTLHDLRKEYEEEEMKWAVKQLHNFFKRQCKGDRKKVVDTYNHIVESQRKIHNGKSELFENRKKVSHFYQKLATYYSENVIYKKILFPSWSCPDLNLLGECIIPIEESIEGHSKKAIENLKKLYKSFKDYQDC